MRWEYEMVGGDFELHGPVLASDAPMPASAGGSFRVAAERP
jgi:hypothetical protein